MNYEAIVNGLEPLSAVTSLGVGLWLLFLAGMAAAGREPYQLPPRAIRILALLMVVPIIWLAVVFALEGIWSPLVLAVAVGLAVISSRPRGGMVVGMNSAAFESSLVKVVGARGNGLEASLDGIRFPGCHGPIRVHGQALATTNPADRDLVAEVTAALVALTQETGGVRPWRRVLGFGLLGAGMVAGAVLYFA